MAAADPTADAAVPEPPQLTEEARRGEEGARAVLVAWARALEAKDFAGARAQFRRPSSAPDYAERFARFRTIAVAAPVGRMEGAAGSLYYSSPATVTGTSFGGERIELQASVVLRRANDVPGATAEQLRWRIESAEFKPVN